MDFTTEFLPYLALAVILWSIRETKKVSNTWIPLIAVVLGVLYASWEAGGISPKSFINGCQYALLGVGSVAAVKYFLETHKPYK
jgi:Phage holin family Hol44, in holin superfamily V